ncbi:MAG: molybdopterin molybdenumtransferase MoeA, partial [Deltaproteobacteria bacterium]
FGTCKNKLLFGLPGNPVSTMVSFEIFARPATLKMMGHKYIFRKTVVAQLKENITKKQGLMYFLRGIVTSSDDGFWEVTTTGEQGSGILKSMVSANCLIALPINIHSLKAGELVKVIPFDESLAVTTTADYF